MRLWWVSMSLFMEWEGEQGVVIFSCCSSNGIPHWSGGGEGGGDEHQLLTPLQPHQPVRDPIGGATGEDHHPLLSLPFHEQRHGNPSESH